MQRKLLLVALSLFISIQAWAGAADQFRGWYQVLSSTNSSAEQPKPYLLVDVDTMENIWLKYGDGGPLPKNLEPYRTESTILAGFTQKDFLILALERQALVSGDFMRIEGGGDRLMELKLTGTGAIAGTRDNGQITRYQLAAPVANPSGTPTHSLVFLAP